MVARAQNHLRAVLVSAGVARYSVSPASAWPDAPAPSSARHVTSRRVFTQPSPSVPPSGRSPRPAAAAAKQSGAVAGARLSRDPACDATASGWLPFAVNTLVFLRHISLHGGRYSCRLPRRHTSKLSKCVGATFVLERGFPCSRFLPPSTTFEPSRSHSLQALLPAWRSSLWPWAPSRP